MKKLLTVALCFGLFVNIPSTVKPISKTVHIGSSIVAAVATGLLAGSITYLVINDSEQDEGIALRHGLEEKEKKKNKTNKLLVPIGAGLLGACLGGGATYLILRPYTGKAKVERVDLLLDALEKHGLLDSNQNLDAAFGNGGAGVIDAFIRANSDLSPTPFPAVQKKIDALKTELKNIEMLVREAKKDDSSVASQGADERITRYKNRIARLENFMLVNRRDQFEQQCLEHDKRKELSEHGESYWKNKDNKEDKNRVHTREDKKTNSDCTLKGKKGEFLTNMGENVQTRVSVEV